MVDDKSIFVVCNENNGIVGFVKLSIDNRNDIVSATSTWIPADKATCGPVAAKATKAVKAISDLEQLTAQGKVDGYSLEKILRETK